MAVKAARVRTLALSLPGVTVYPHFDREAFRIPERTFATLASDGSDLNLMFDVAQQAQFCELAPHAIAPVAGGWGRMGWTRCDLERIDSATLRQALEAAYARACEPRTRGRQGGTAGSRASAQSKPASLSKPKAGKRAPRQRAPGAKRPKKSR